MSRGRREPTFQAPEVNEDADQGFDINSRIVTIDGTELTPGQAASRFEVTMEEDWMNGQDTLQIMGEDMTVVQPITFDTTPYTGVLDPDLDPEAYTTQQVFEYRWNTLEAKVEKIMNMMEQLSTVDKIENMKL